MAPRMRRRFASALLSVLAISLSPPGTPGFNQVAAMTSGEARVPLEPGRTTGTQPVGLFYRVEVSAVGSRRVDTRTWLFLPGQRVSRVHPFGGVGAFDPSRCNPDTCGTYQIGAGQLTVRWDGGLVHQWAFAASASGISLDGALYRPARVMTAAALIGQWVSPGDGGSNVYTFDGNGRFRFGTGQGGLTGTYRAQGFALSLTFSDGDVRRRTLFAASAGEPVGMISVEGEVYARK